jgi:hypothetical protein
LKEPALLVRNTVSGVTVDLPVEKTLGHAWFSRFYVPVDKPKNEVLAQPYEVEDGERKPLATKVTAKADTATQKPEDK